MGFWEKANDAFNAFSSAMDKKAEDIKARYRRECRGKSDDELLRMLEGARYKGSEVAEEIISEELDRRGIYY